MPCGFMKIPVLMKYFKVRCSVCACVCVFMENKSDLFPHLLIIENTAQAKKENRSQDVPSVTQNNLWLRIFCVMTINHNKTPGLRSINAGVNLGSTTHWLCGFGHLV